MMENPQGHVDRLEFDTLVNADRAAGPKVSIFLPSKVAGGGAIVTAGHLRDETDKAAQDLMKMGVEKDLVEQMLQPARELQTDPDFWMRQSRGLAVFAAEDFFRAVRIPLEVSLQRTVDEHFNVLPLASMLEQEGRVYVLALSKNQVRLFDATRNHIEELPLGEIPENYDAVVGETPEQYLGFRATADGPTGFYGTGGRQDSEDHFVESFLRQVGEGVAKELGTARSQPLILASVSEYLSPFRRLCPYPNVQDVMIEGNPERTRPEELRSKAWELLNDLARQEDEGIDNARSRIAAGKGSYDLGEILKAAREGRVDTVFLPKDLQRLAATGGYSLASQAVLATMNASGSVRTVAQFPESLEAAATFRY